MVAENMSENDVAFLLRKVSQDVETIKMQISSKKVTDLDLNFF